jgi:hypothetical protein
MLWRNLPRVSKYEPISSPGHQTLLLKLALLSATTHNYEMLNQVQHDHGGRFSVTLNLLQGLKDTDSSV